MNSVKQNINNETGFALPLALMVLLFVLSVGTLMTDISVGTYNQNKLYEAVQDTFFTAEGAAHDIMRQMAVTPEIWREASNLAENPSNYTAYSPYDYTSTNGIPVCSGVACHRNMYPVGGGLIKNFGPMGFGGDTVDINEDIVDQLDPSNLPSGDLNLNGQMAWAQVERLDEVFFDEDSMGGSLENNWGTGTSANSIRFRITGTTRRTVRQREGLTTVVYVVEVPAS